MKILFCMRNSATNYGGGRYHGWILAEALSSRGYNVHIWTNNVPVFNQDFIEFPGHNRLNVILTSQFIKSPRGRYDVIVIVPDMNKNGVIYYKSLLIAARDRAKVVIINFETPNWFNKYSPEHRNPDLWKFWNEVSEKADLILSSAKESTHYARLHYSMASSNVIFRHHYPPINSIACDKVETLSKKKKIICITRFKKDSAHKGGNELLKTIGPWMKGYELAIIVGSGIVSEADKQPLFKRAKKYDINIRFLYRLSDKEKFTEIKESVAMLFLSYFEGFGYPPGEALYCNVPCIVYDLPVLREIYGDYLIYVPAGNHEALRKSLERVLTVAPRQDSSLKNCVADKLGFQPNAIRIDQLFRENLKPITKPASASTTKKQISYWNRQIFRSLLCNFEYKQTRMWTILMGLFYKIIKSGNN